MLGGRARRGPAAAARRCATTAPGANARARRPAPAPGSATCASAWPASTATASGCRPRPAPDGGTDVRARAARGHGRRAWLSGASARWWPTTSRMARDAVVTLLRRPAGGRGGGRGGVRRRDGGAVRRLRPDLLFLDVQMPGGDGFRGARGAGRGRPARRRVRDRVRRARGARVRGARARLRGEAVRPAALRRRRRARGRRGCRRRTRSRCGARSRRWSQGRRPDAAGHAGPARLPRPRPERLAVRIGTRTCSCRWRRGVDRVRRRLRAHPRRPARSTSSPRACTRWRSCSTRGTSCASTLGDRRAWPAWRAAARRRRRRRGGAALGRPPARRPRPLGGAGAGARDRVSATGVAE